MVGGLRGYGDVAKNVGGTESSISSREEKRGIGTNSISFSETKAIVPIVSSAEVEIGEMNGMVGVCVWGTK